MSGRHAVVKPRRVRLTLLLVPARFVWRAARAAGVAVGDWRRQASAWWQSRWDRRDPFAVETSPTETSPDPVPAVLPAPVEPAAPEPAPVYLTPREAYTSLHTVHPLLPGHCIRWHFGGDNIHGEVNSLDCNPLEQRAAVNGYADALQVQVREQDAGDGHTLLTATGVHAGVTVIVTAVLLVDDTIPLRVFEEAAEDETLDDTLTTQAIPERVLAEVLGQ